MTPQPIAASESPSPRMSEAARVAGVFTDPKRAFADIAWGPRWWVPFGLLVILSLVQNITFSKRVGWEHYMTQKMESNPRTQNMTPEQRELAVAQATKFVAVGAYAGPVVGIPVGALVISAAMLLVFNAALGAQLKFKQAFGITFYAMLPMAVASALAIVVMFLKNPDDFDLENPLAFNIGAFLDPQSTPKWLVSMGTSIDLFSFWVILLLAIGLSAAAARKLSLGKAIAGVAGPWAVYVVVKSALAGFYR